MIYYNILRLERSYFIYSFNDSQINNSSYMERINIPEDKTKKIDTILFLRGYNFKNSVETVRVSKDIYEMVRNEK